MSSKVSYTVYITALSGGTFREGTREDSGEAKRLAGAACGRFGVARVWIVDLDGGTVWNWNAAHGETVNKD